ncbi:MAG: response regulator [Thermodesulfovibrionales bacterium]|jgi:CheY-like chemotaxis protein
MNKVVVIEDDKDNLLLITYILKRGGYEVIPAETGEEGADLVVRETPSFAIVDISLPGINGFETAERIKADERGKGVPLIAITAHAMAGDRERIMASGFSGYFEKPIDPLTIVAEIHKTIGSTPR